MTVRTKLSLLMGALVFANFALWGMRQFLNGSLDPIVRALHG